jgi:hypothetical protein
MRSDGPLLLVRPNLLPLAIDKAVIELAQLTYES